MDERIVQAEQLNERIQNLFDYLITTCKFQIDKLIEAAESDNFERLEKEWTVVIHECLIKCWQEEDSSVRTKEYKEFKKFLLMELRARSRNIQNDRYPSQCLIEEFFFYCYQIRHSIFSGIYIAYPGGYSYDEFVQDIYAEKGIEGDWKSESLSYRKYRSNKLMSSKEFVPLLLSYRKNHQGISDKNKNNKQWYYESILPYEKAGHTFEFLMKKRNSKKNESSMSVGNKIEEVRKKEIEPIVCFFEVDQENYVMEYAKLRGISIKEMTKQQLYEYLEFIELKKEYVNRYSNPDFRVIELLNIDESLNLNIFDVITILRRLKYDVNMCDQVRSHFNEIGYVLQEIINLGCGNSKRGEELRPVMWSALVQLINKVDGIFYSTPYIKTNWRKRGVKIDVLRSILGKKPELSIERLINAIQDGFAKNLMQKDDGLRDYIEICFLSQHIIPDVKLLEDIETLVKGIFILLKACQDQVMEGSDIMIETQLEDLKELLKKNVINLDVDYEDTYDYTLFKDHFQTCAEMRYVDLSQFLRAVILDNSCTGIELFIKKYLNTVLFEFADAKVRKPKRQKKAAVEEIVLSNLISCLYPNQLEVENYHVIYEAKSRALEIAEKYNLKENLGF